MTTAEVLLVRDVGPAIRGLEPDKLVYVRDENAPPYSQLRLAGGIEEWDGSLVIVVPRTPPPGEGRHERLRRSAACR